MYVGRPLSRKTSLLGKLALCQTHEKFHRDWRVLGGYMAVDRYPAGRQTLGGSVDPLSPGDLHIRDPNGKWKIEAGTDGAAVVVGSSPRQDGSRGYSVVEHLDKRWGREDVFVEGLVDRLPEDT